MNANDIDVNALLLLWRGRWDITKHIKLKAARDPGHAEARVLLLDASGERNYDQYDRFLVMMRVTETGETR